MEAGRVSNPSGANNCAGPTRMNIDSEKHTLDDHSECRMQMTYSDGAALATWPALCARTLPRNRQPTLFWRSGRDTHHSRVVIHPHSSSSN